MKIIVAGDFHGHFGPVNTMIAKQNPSIILQCGDFGWWPRVHGHLEFELGFDICSFVSGEIKDIEFQNAIIFDLNDVKHDAKIVLAHDEQDRIYGYIVSPEEDLEKIKDQMIKSIKRYNCI